MTQKVTSQEVKTRLDKMNLVDQFLFNEVMEYQDAFEATVSILSGELRRLGLGLPSALEAAHLLRERRGVDVGEPLTLDALADALAGLARGPREGA